MWSKGDVEPAGKMRDLVEWLQENDFTLMNEKGKCTYHEHRRRGVTSVLDLTWANTPALALNVTKEWAIDPDLACRSDHFALKWVIDHGATEVQNVTGNRFNFKDTKLAAWQEAFQEEMKANTERWESLQDLNTNRTLEDLNKDVELITEAMKRATDRTAKIRKPSEKGRPWWTEELTEANNKRMALRENQRAYMAHWGEPNREIDREIRKVTNYFRRLYKHKKREWIDKTLKEATPENMWGLRGWSKGTRNYPSPAIRRQNVGPAVEHEDKCDALREALFKLLPELENNEEPDMELEQEKDFAHVKVTREEVKEEIYPHSMKKAPGVSQQLFNTVQWAWGAEEDTIFALMHHCIETGHHPKIWHRAVAVALRKPKKPDYSEPRAYRLIQLLECLGKVLEGIVARRISHLVGREDLVPPTQFGGRPNSSTNDALLMLQPPTPKKPPDVPPNFCPCPAPILANSDASPANSDGPLANFNAFPAATDTYPGSPEPQEPPPLFPIFATHHQLNTLVPLTYSGVSQQPWGNLRSPMIPSTYQSEPRSSLGPGLHQLQLISHQTPAPLPLITQPPTPLLPRISHTVFCLNPTKAVPFPHNPTSPDLPGSVQITSHRLSTQAISAQNIFECLVTSARGSRLPSKDSPSAAEPPRLHKLKSTNPVIERLQQDWRGGEEGINPPPLPTRRKTQNKKLTKLTQIEKIEKMTYKPGKGENIDPFISPSWRETTRDHGNRLTVMGTPKKCKKAEEAQRHNERLETMELDNTHLIIYSDGSMREDDMGGNTKIVRWGIVGYHKGREVFSDRGGLGSNAEVYDTELVGIAQATKAATNYAKRKQQVRHVRLFADNTAAVTLAYRPKPTPGQLQMVKITHQVNTFLGENLGILLGTKDGLKATTKFLEKSGAFTKTGTKRQQIKKPTEHDDENNEEEEAWWRRMERERETTDGLVEEEEEERYRDMDEERRGDEEE
ncbi:putative 115 kDa protein in type-1 retrotransposable element [Termitomyces sp. T112]|nr:putative 115 kDa protein in type-1 retrotransposable element [Termitomyces sp. T112]